jgi:hypothetical protein
VWQKPGSMHGVFFAKEQMILRVHYLICSLGLLGSPFQNLYHGSGSVTGLAAARQLDACGTRISAVRFPSVRLEPIDAAA